jgi:hypothetical protein
MNTALCSSFWRSLLPLSAAERDCRGVVGRGGRHVLPFLAVAAMLVVVGGLSRPADAQVVTWDFTATSGSWTQQNVAQVGPPPVSPKWEYGMSFLSGKGNRWSVRSGSTPATGNYLTSPLIKLDVPADKFTFTMAHRYRFKSDDDDDDDDDDHDDEKSKLFKSDDDDDEKSKPIPLEAGQLEYSLDGANFLPVFNTDWLTSGTVSGNVSPFVNYETWVPPTYIPGANEFPLIQDGASFVGYSPSLPSWVGSQTQTVDFPGATTTLQFRLTHANLGEDDLMAASSLLSGGGEGGDEDWGKEDWGKGKYGWEVRWAEVEIVNLPEPSTYAMLGVCLSLAALMWWRRLQTRRAAA